MQVTNSTLWLTVYKLPADNVLRFNIELQMRFKWLLIFVHLFSVKILIVLSILT